MIQYTNSKEAQAHIRKNLQQNCGALTTRLNPAKVLSPLTTHKAVGSLENCHWGSNLAEKFKLSVTPSRDKSKTRKLSYTLGLQPNNRNKKSSSGGINKIIKLSTIKIQNTNSKEALEHIRYKPYHRIVER